MCSTLIEACGLMYFLVCSTCYIEYKTHFCRDWLMRLHIGSSLDSNGEKNIQKIGYFIGSRNKYMHQRSNGPMLLGVASCWPLFDLPKS